MLPSLVGSELGAHHLAMSLLEDLVRETAGLRRLARDLRAPHGDRSWIRVADTPGADAWLIAWSPSSWVDTHDHGDSHGAIHVLRGALTESYRDAEDPSREHVRRLVRGRSAGIPRNRVHEVANFERGPALSLHVYSPRLTTMRFYPETDGAPAANVVTR